MKFWKTVFALYQVIISSLSILCILILIFYSELVSSTVFGSNAFLVSLIIVPSVVFCFCNALRLLLPARNIFAKWEGLAQTGIVFSILCTLLFAYVLIPVGGEPGISYTHPSRTLLAYRDVSSSSSLKPEQIAPDFSGKDQFGKTLWLSELKGKIILLNFWETWCGPCRHELPYIQKIWERHHNEGLVIIGINLDHDPEKFREFVEEEVFSYSQIHDQDREIQKSYDVHAIPACFLINEQGKIIGTNVGGTLLVRYVGQVMNAYLAGKKNGTIQLNEKDFLQLE
jgi:peroxiredoxin